MFAWPRHACTLTKRLAISEGIHRLRQASWLAPSAAACAITKSLNRREHEWAPLREYRSSADLTVYAGGPQRGVLRLDDDGVMTMRYKRENKEGAACVCFHYWLR